MKELSDESSLRALETARFRASAAYELVAFDGLDAEQRAALRDATRNPDFYGIVRPVGTATRDVRAVDRDTALLLLTLRTPGPFPSYARRLGERGVWRDAARLVGDGLLEIEHEGSFVSGAAAYNVLFGSACPAARTVTARLSLDALAYGERLDVDVVSLAASLYSYNREPLSPSWMRRLPTDHSVVEFLGLETARRTSEVYWDPVEVAAEDPWLAWRSRHSRGARDEGPSYKLYVSPRAEQLPDAVRASLAPLGRSGALYMKMARTRAGILRADKLVAYFDALDSLREAARLLATELSGLPPQGVPFTSDILGDGLLSWGMDPPLDPWPHVRPQRESWRSWLATRLATLLVEATPRVQDQLVHVRRTEFALQRLRLDGVDTVSWTPALTIWSP